ncbi:hypothetical protein Shyhy02_31020 [Streptomyces hygroscopicus subsp. hygroscopicus]|nr:hypothetical protein Shyhy02_31020 [Streptomyces hygroscopicus subsp. hygroscopicus]
MRWLLTAVVDGNRRALRSDGDQGAARAVIVVRAVAVTQSVLWNAHAGALWVRFTTYLRRELAAHLGITQKALNAAVRVSFAKVAEYQRRGQVHFHAVIRLDGPEGSNEPPPACPHPRDQESA